MEAVTPPSLPPPRFEEPAPEEPVLKGFWARSATALAVFSTYEVVCLYATPALVRMGEAVTGSAELAAVGAALLKAAGLAWLAAIGFTRANPSARP